MDRIKVAVRSVLYFTVALPFIGYLSESMVLPLIFPLIISLLSVGHDQFFKPRVFFDSLTFAVLGVLGLLTHFLGIYFFSDWLLSAVASFGFTFNDTAQDIFARYATETTLGTFGALIAIGLMAPALMMSSRLIPTPASVHSPPK